QALEDYVADIEKAPKIVRLFAAAHKKFDSACQRSEAQMQCMIVALAVERYRLKHGHWPQTLAEVGPEFLKAIPLDPFDGQPLRYRCVADGVIIYSVGPDGVDDGGNIQRQKPTNEPGTDLGFQLWNPDQRRQPAPPEAAKP